MIDHADSIYLILVDCFAIFKLDKTQVLISVLHGFTNATAQTPVKPIKFRCLLDNVARTLLKSCDAFAFRFCIFQLQLH